MGIAQHIKEHEALDTLDKSQADLAYAKLVDVLNKDQTTPQITTGIFNLYGMRLPHLGTNATDYATQQSSGILRLETSNWTGSVESTQEWTMQSIVSTTAQVSDLYMKKGTTNAFRIASTSINGIGEFYFYIAPRVETSSSSTTGNASGPRFGVKNTNSTVNNYGSFNNINGGGLTSGSVLFRNISHSGSIGSADLEIWLSNAGAATKKATFNKEGDLTLTRDIVANKHYFATNAYMEYNATDLSLDFVIV